MNKLVAVLQQQLETLQNLVSITKQEQQAIIKRDIQMLQSICSEKAALQNSLEHLEKERYILAAGRSLTELAKETGDNKILTLRKPLKDVLQELRNMQMTNNLLIKNEFAYWNQLKSAFFSQNTPYTASGVLAAKGNQAKQLISQLA